MTKHTPLQTRIRDQLQRRFGEDLHVGDRVNEAEIADALGISRTPVRKVLWQLQNEGVVSYEQHRGFRLADASSNVFDPDAEKNELLDERVMRDMALGHLSSVISERALMQKYTVPHGILMSTLRRLMRDQLVEPSVGHGWIFSDVSATALESGYKFRQILEPATILADPYFIDVEAFQAIDREHANTISNIEKVDQRRLFDLDAKFHRLIALGARSTHLVDSIERQNNIRRVNEYIGFARLERVRESLGEHRNIIAALLRSERQVAAALMRLHLQISRDETFKYIDDDLERVRAGDLHLSLEQE